MIKIKSKFIFVLTGACLFSLFSLGSCSSDKTSLNELNNDIEVSDYGLKLAVKEADLSNDVAVKELTYNVLPSNATDRRIDYIISWENSDSLSSNDFGFNKNPNDFISVSIDEYRQTIRLNCLASFGTPIVIRFYSLSNKNAYADLICRFEQKVTNAHFELEIPSGDVGADSSVDDGIFITKKSGEDSFLLNPYAFNYAMSEELNIDNLMNNINYFNNEVSISGEISFNDCYTDSIIQNGVRIDNYDQYESRFSCLVEINDIINRNPMFENELNGFRFNNFNILQEKINELNDNYYYSAFPGPDDFYLEVEEVNEFSVKVSGPFYGFTNIDSENINYIFNSSNDILASSDENIIALLGEDGFNAINEFVNQFSEYFETVIINYENTSLYDDYIKILILLDTCYEKAYTINYLIYFNNANIYNFNVYFGFESLIEWDPLIEDYLR